MKPFQLNLQWLALFVVMTLHLMPSIERKLKTFISLTPIDVPNTAILESSELAKLVNELLLNLVC